MSTDAALDPVGLEPPAEPSDDVESTLATLFHRLNNQLGAGLANAELIEVKSSEEPQRSRAGQIVEAVLGAMTTAHELRNRLIPIRRTRD